VSELFRYKTTATAVCFSSGAHLKPKKNEKIFNALRTFICIVNIGLIFENQTLSNTDRTRLL
jgi:hypothetical protein